MLDSTARRFNASFHRSVISGHTIESAFEHAVWVVKSSPGVEDPEREAAKFYQPPQSTWTELQAGETNVVITQAQNSVECSSGSTNVVLESDSVLLIVLLQ